MPNKWLQKVTVTACIVWQLYKNTNKQTKRLLPCLSQWWSWFDGFCVVWSVVSEGQWQCCWSLRRWAVCFSLCKTNLHFFLTSPNKSILSRTYFRLQPCEFISPSKRLHWTLKVSENLRHKLLTLAHLGNIKYEFSKNKIATVSSRYKWTLNLWSLKVKGFVCAAGFPGLQRGQLTKRCLEGEALPFQRGCDSFHGSQGLS